MQCMTCHCPGVEKIFYVPRGCTVPRQRGLLCEECWGIGVRCGALGVHVHPDPTFAAPQGNCLVHYKSLELIQNLRAKHEKESQLSKKIRESEAL